MNVVLITVDTTRADALGAYGQPLDSSPYIDRMAKQGVLFERAVTSNPETLPSHATLFTGKFPFAHGVRANAGYVLSDENETLAEILKAAGYRTSAQVAAKVLNETTQIQQGFGRYTTPDSPGVVLKTVQYSGGTNRKFEVPIRVASDITKKGVDFIRTHREREFFLWLHYFDPHVPYSAPAHFNDRIPSSPYHAEIASADRQIGVLLEQIERMGLRENTLVILTSDHGEGLGEHDELTHSYFVYQTTMHVPLIFWGPSRLVEGKRVKASVRTADVAPTVLDMLGLPTPDGLDGESLEQALVGNSDEVDRIAYGESIEVTKVFATSPLRIIVDGRWKYIHKVVPLLFDLDADPGELTNVASENPEVLERLRAHLKKMLAEAVPAPDNASAPIDDETRARLEALGYLAGPTDTRSVERLDTFELSGKDPDEKAGDIVLLGRISAFITRKEWALALDLIDRLLENNAESAHIHSLRSKVLVDFERPAEAAKSLKRVVELDPLNLEDRQILAKILDEEGRRGEAIDVLLEVLPLGQCSDTVWSSLNGWLLTEHRYADRVSMLAEATSRCPDSSDTLNNYAWALATSPDDETRDGALAVETALRASKLHGAPDPAYLDTLAAAYAEAGDFERARRTEAKAIQLLESQGYPRQVVDAFRANLAEFEAGRAIRESG